MQKSIGALHLLGARRLRGEARARADTSRKHVTSVSSKKPRSLLDSGLYSDLEISIAAEGNDRLLSLASESRKGLVEAFYNLLRKLVPGFQLQEAGTVKQCHIDYLCNHLSDQAFNVLGEGGFMIFRVSQMEGTEDSILFRGEVDGNTFDVLVNTVKEGIFLLHLYLEPCDAVEEHSG